MQKCLDSEAECQNFFEALERLSREPVKGLRVNGLREGGGTYLSPSLEAFSRVEWEAAARLPDRKTLSDWAKHPAAGAGLFYIQEPGAMLAVPMLDPRPGELCLDLCAAPGGKSTQILERLRGRGWLVTNEFVRARAQLLDAIVARHGALNVSVFSMDPADLAELYPSRFDAIMVDAPCSGESLFAKRNEQRSDVRDADVRGCAVRQERILAAAAAMLKSNGRIVYSTCTYNREENEEVVEKFLAQHPEFRLTREHRLWPHREGVAGGYGARLERGAEVESSTLHAVFEPAEKNGLIRHALRRWDGEWDEYAAAMGREVPAQLFAGEIQVSDTDARRYLHGESLAVPPEAPRGLVRITWRGWPLGPGRAVEGRVNNLLPKNLRTA